MDTAALGWTEAMAGGGKRWLSLDPPYTGSAREVVSNKAGISSFGWTNKGTPYFSLRSKKGTEVSIFVVAQDHTPKMIWEGAVKDIYGNPGSAMRINGDRGPVLEYERNIFLSSDGLGAEGPRPYIDSLNLDSLEITRLATAKEGVYERLVGIVDPETRTVLTVRESETEPPRLFSVTAGKHTPVGGVFESMIATSAASAESSAARMSRIFVAAASETGASASPRRAARRRIWSTASSPEI